MSGITRGTTPNLIFNCSSDLDLTTLTEIWFTIAQKNKEITFKLSSGEVFVDNDKKTISVTLEQNKSLALEAGKAQVQIRASTGKSPAYATDTYTVDISPILKGGVIGG